MGQQIDKPLSDVSYIQKYCLNPYITYQNANVNIVEPPGRHTRLSQMIAIYTNFRSRNRGLSISIRFRTADKYTAKWMLRGIPQFRWDCGISMQRDHDFSEFTVPFRRPTILWVSCISLSEISVPMWEMVKCHATASHVLNTPDQWLICFKISSNSDCSHHPCPSPDISIKLYLWSI